MEQLTEKDRQDYLLCKTELERVTYLDRLLGEGKIVLVYDSWNSGCNINYELKFAKCWHGKHEFELTVGQLDTFKPKNVIKAFKEHLKRRKKYSRETPLHRLLEGSY